MADFTKIGIEKLSNSNYFNWKFRMEMFLTKEKLWDYVHKEGTAAEIVKEEWIKSNAEARAVIVLCVDDSQLNIVRNAQSAFETWKKLKEHHEKNTLTSRVHLMRRICSLSLNEGGNLQIHIDKMLELFQKLKDLGETGVTDKWIIAMMLSSLPTSYDSLITTLE
jgi:hypothetical protein